MLESHRNSPIRVLLVEDDPSVLEGICMFLEDCGLRVRTATTVTDALRILAEHEEEIIVLDLVLGDENSVSILERLDDRRDLPVIISTGMADHRELSSWRNRKGVEVLAKPYSMPRLLETILRMVGADRN